MGISPTGIPLLTVPEEDTIVCPGKYVVLNCTVQNAPVLRWTVGSTQITCPGVENVGFLCHSSTATIYAIIKDVVHHRRLRPRIPNNDITSSITITDIDNHLVIICESQVEGESPAREAVYVSSMFIITLLFL